YDALAPYRDAVAALVDGLARDPLTALALVRPLSRSMAIVLEDAGVSSEGGLGALRQKALAALHLSLLRTWLNDDSADLAKTMAALDKGLKRLGRWADVIESTRKRAIFRRRERPTKDAPAAAGDAPV
ncbi:MAG: TetR/AcrR family transcriptional regulator, partial [Rhodospirillales bacterium]|nr:TetR/AcrR family transcriptional regulator [Rhodospirillales bacterium]